MSRYIERGLRVYEIRRLGWIAEGRHFTGTGLTRKEALNDWVQNVKRGRRAGSYYVRQAESIALRLQ